MTPDLTPPRARLLGRADGTRPGPTVVLVAGLHGNEPAGLAAARQVLADLRQLAPSLHGTVVAVAGNLGALAAGRRLLDVDLNRLWAPEHVAALRRRDPGPGPAEEQEQRELVALFTELEAQAGGDLLYLDLHTTSAPSAPFLCISDTLRSRRIALATPVPLVLGLEETIRGTLLDWFEERAVAGLLVEGGQHDDPHTPAALEAVIWHALVAAGSIAPGAAPALDEHARRLRRAARGLPRVLEVRRRHPRREGDGFRMLPGWRNFDVVARGTVVAEGRHGPIRAEEDGRLLMPQYQEQGDDGFFLARAVRPRWLGLSTAARALGLDRLLRRLPGVQRDPVRPDRVLVDPAVARWGTRQLFHLAGYRRLPARNGWLVFTRRVEP